MVFFIKKIVEQSNKRKSFSLVNFFLPIVLSQTNHNITVFKVQAKPRNEINEVTQLLISKKKNNGKRLPKFCISFCQILGLSTIY